MSELNSLDISVVTKDGTKVDFEDVQYLSWVNGETYGIPALISDAAVKQEVKEDGDVTIVYVSTENVAAVLATRKDPADVS